MLILFRINRLLFQYLGSRGAQPYMRDLLSEQTKFQYLGSRGAQL